MFRRFLSALVIASACLAAPALAQISLQPQPPDASACDGDTGSACGLLSNMKRLN